MATNHLFDGLHHQASHSTLEHNPYPQHSQRQIFGPSPGVYHVTDANKWQGQTPKTAKEENKVIGLRKSTFFVICLLVLLIVGAVAGGMGAALAQSKRKTADAQRTASASTPPQNASSTTGTPTTISAASATGTIIKSSSLTVVRDCPSSNGTTAIIAVSPPQRFQKFCSFLLDTNPTNAFANITTSLDACIGLCASYNTLTSGDTEKCNGVAWRWGSDPPWGMFGMCFGLVGLTGTEGRLADGSTSTTPVDSAYLLS